MSDITNILIQGATQESIQKLNDWLLEHDVERHQQLEIIRMEAAGGTKWYARTVHAAAFNALPYGFIDLLADPETWGYDILSVMILIDPEGVENRRAIVFQEAPGEEETHWMIGLVRPRDGESIVARVPKAEQPRYQDAQLFALEEMGEGWILR